VGESDLGTRSDVERLPTAFTASFQAHGRTWKGVAVNVSRKGLCLRTDTPLDEGDVITLALDDPEGGAVPLQGKVRWVIELSPLLQPTFPFEAGVALEEPSPQFDALFTRESAHFVDYRDDIRVPHQMRVELAGPGFWETTFALNLGRRGLFIRTDQHLDPGQLVEIRMSLPGMPGMTQVRGEVVHVLAGDHSQDVGAQPGIGVRFSSLPSGFRERYQGYVDDVEQRFRS
jgi:uncharacterized protein (TIGR02266 family)